MCLRRGQYFSHCRQEFMQEFMSCLQNSFRLTPAEHSIAMIERDRDRAGQDRVGDCGLVLLATPYPFSDTRTHRERESERDRETQR